MPDFLLNIVFQHAEVLLSDQARSQQVLAHLRQRIAPGFFLPPFFRLVQPLVIRERVRVRTNHVAVQKRRPMSAAHMLDGSSGGFVGLRKVGAVALEAEQVRKIFDQARNVAARRLHVGRHGDGISIVLHDYKQGKLARRRGVE